MKTVFLKAFEDSVSCFCDKSIHFFSQNVWKWWCSINDIKRRPKQILTSEKVQTENIYIYSRDYQNNWQIPSLLMCSQNPSVHLLGSTFQMFSPGTSDRICGTNKCVYQMQLKDFLQPQWQQSLSALLQSLYLIVYCVLRLMFKTKIKCFYQHWWLLMSLLLSLLFGRKMQQTHVCFYSYVFNKFTSSLDVL